MRGRPAGRLFVQGLRVALVPDAARIDLETMVSAGVDGVVERPADGDLFGRVEPFLRGGRSASGMWGALRPREAEG